jgi:hypothetical protein
MAAVAAVAIFSGKSPAAVTTLVVARGCLKKKQKIYKPLKVQNFVLQNVKSFIL